VIESLTGMTSTTKRRIAREWLIFLVCIVIGLSGTYFTFYFGKRIVRGTHIEYVDSKGGRHLSPYDELLEKRNPDDNAIHYKKVVVSDWRDKNAKDLFNDLTSRQYADRPYTRRLYVLSPYLVVLFVRSIIWSVNTLRRPKQSSP